MFSYSAKANYPGSPAAAPAWCSRGSWGSPRPCAEFLGGSWGAGGAGLLVPDPRTAPPASGFIPGCPHPHHPPLPQAAGGLWPWGGTPGLHPRGCGHSAGPWALSPLSLGGTGGQKLAAPPQLSLSFSCRC